MHPFVALLPTHRAAARLAGCLALAALISTLPAQAQSLCSSAGVTPPPALLERFVSADCASCWTDPATPPTPADALALDWIMPTSAGEAAPLSAVARRDTLERLEALQLAPPTSQSSHTTRVLGWPGASLRVEHGVAVGRYVGASIELTLPARAAVRWPLHAWLGLVESLPAGTEGSPVPRDLVRNTLQPIWNLGDALLNSEQMSFKEFRAMNLPEGASFERLHLVGWVQDGNGQVGVAAVSSCPPEDNAPTEPQPQ